MTPQQIDAMKQALEALQGLIKKTSGQSIYSFMETERRIAMSACVFIKEALAEHAMRETQRLGQEIEQEPVAWRNAAIRVGEDLSSVGPDGYYDMTAQQWLDWALSVVTVHAPPPQRTEQEPSSVQQAYAMAQVCLDLHDALGCKWGDNVYLAIDQLKAAAHTQQRKPLTDEQIAEVYAGIGGLDCYLNFYYSFARAIEAAHGIKETK
jgi:hypothetical protein